ALAFGQLRKRAAECQLDLGAIDRLLDILWRTLRHIAPLQPAQAKPLQKAAPSLLGGRFTNHCEQPRPERRPAVVPGFALKHFEIDRVQDAFRLRGIARATAERPAVAFAMMSLQFSPQLGIVHLIRSQVRYCLSRELVV